MDRKEHTLVFMGPTLAVAEARRILPDAAYLPPAAVGDVYLMARQLSQPWRPARIAIVDGYFERMAAVWHKEVLYALERGILVYGAASMGALRAAELASFGMIGVGQVVADYQSGRLADDDEVAVGHAPPELGYTLFSEAMVNVRAGLRQAHERSLISSATRDALVRLGKQQFYRDRTWDSVLGAGHDAGLPAGELRALAEMVARDGPDVKAADARALLERLARDPLPTERPGPSWRMARTWFWERFTEMADEQVDEQD